MPHTDKLIHITLQALRTGQVILYPTETLPSFGYDPSNPTARERLVQGKSREEAKAVSCLVNSLTMALDVWKPLPGNWEQTLARIWPAPLTVIWQAKENIPKGLAHTDGTIGLRWPKLPDTQLWVLDLIRELGYPLPTTSVNISGEPPATTWEEAVALGQKLGVCIPNLGVCNPEFLATPSTVIALLPDGDYRVLRQGDFSMEFLRV